MSESRNTYRVLVGRPKGRKPLGRPRRRWEDNIKMNLREVGYDGGDWIGLAQDRDQWRAYVRAAMNPGFLKSQQQVIERFQGDLITFCELNNLNLGQQVYRQVGASAHTGHGNLILLQELFPGRLISRGSDFPYPARSPDLSLCDAFLWGILKEQCFIPVPRTLDALHRNSYAQPNKISYYSVEKLLSSSLLSKNLKVRIYKTVILPVLLYGCETWTLTLREEHRLRVFENKLLRKIFGAKRDEVTGEWRKLHNTELHELYSSPDIIRNIKSRRLRWAGHVARMGESRNAYRVLVGRPEGKKTFGEAETSWCQILVEEIEGASVSTRVESQIKDLPTRHGTRVRPSGLLPSERLIPEGSKMDGMEQCSFNDVIER
ncbi:hypothetical protein ANN_11861 [Periplaneta americana]|uniref:Uncharacterized protein n=1 Tax=Periplaneta americana TaxID=6978 RepID=A0ABQ8T813_PERAM|nr:hypothetical protein ANN_11861 [Periplaneta americana]